MDRLKYKNEAECAAVYKKNKKKKSTNIDFNFKCRDMFNRPSVQLHFQKGKLIYMTYSMTSHKL